MAFFLARSAFCIGAVAMAASGVGPVADALRGEARGAAEGLGRACLASTACLRAGAATIENAPRLATASRDADPGPRAPDTVGRRIPPSTRR